MFGNDYNQLNKPSIRLLCNENVAMFGKLSGSNRKVRQDKRFYTKANSST